MRSTEKLRITIRVDGDNGEEAGMGHVYRSLAYSKLLIAHNSDLSVSFLMREMPEGIAKVSEAGYNVTIIPKVPSLDDYDRVLSILSPHILIIDILGGSNDLMISANRHVKSIITLDDLNDAARYSDIIINGILWGTRLLPERFGRAKVYQGIEYLTLREQFAEANKQQRILNQKINSILISTGGADGRGFTVELINIVKSISSLSEIFVIVGPAFPDDFVNIAAVINDGRFHFLKDIQNMDSYYLKTDLAIITGGTVMFEAAACGTPSLVISSYEHQIPQVRWFSEKKAVIEAGFFPGSINPDIILSKILMLDTDHKKRYEMSSISRKLVDGHGLFRVVKIIESELNKQFKPG